MDISAQDYPFMKEFQPGYIVLKDSSRKQGFIRWFPSQKEKLRYREKESSASEKFAPSELAGFVVDTFVFESLTDFEAYGDYYPMLGRTSSIKETFGRVLHKGKISMYLVFYYGYESVSGAINYPNVVFTRYKDGKLQYVSYPVFVKMKEKRYEKAKQPLIEFFADYPEIVQLVKAYTRDSNFMEILDKVRMIE